MNILNELRAYSGMMTYEELSDKLEEINNRVNSKCHTATGKIHVLHLEKEKDFLHELPHSKLRSHYQIEIT